MSWKRAQDGPSSFREHGIALAVALFALVVVGALVAAAFFAGTQEQRIGENQRYSLQAFAVAEGGVYEVVRRWLPESINIRPIYPADSFPVADTTTAAGTGTYGGWVYKLNRNLYLVDVAGSDAASHGPGVFGGRARHRIGVLVRARPIDFGVEAALTTHAPVSLADDAMVDGNPHVPPGWTDCDTLSDTARAGVRIRDSAQVIGAAGRTAGSPSVYGDTSVQAALFRQFGDVSYDRLASRATVVLPAGSYTTRPSRKGDGSCNTVDVLNWGDGLEPDAACGGHFPIIHITGAAGVTVLQGGHGQGILLVDGDLTVQGGYAFFGVTIVQGRLRTRTAHFWGAVMARSRDLAPHQLSAATSVTYAKCPIVRALQYSAVAAQVPSRGWVELF